MESKIIEEGEKTQSTWTSNCNVFIKLNGTPEQAKVVFIREIKDLGNISNIFIIF